MTSELIQLILYLGVGVIVLIVIGTIFTTGLYSIARKIILWLRSKGK